MYIFFFREFQLITVCISNRMASSAINDKFDE